MTTTAITTTSAADQSLIPATNNTNYNISPDQFEIVISKLPEDQQDTLRFWYFLGKDRSWSLSALSRACGVSTTTLSRVFRGDYGAELTSLCASLEKARASYSESVENPEFIMTSLAKQMFQVFDSTRALHTVSFMLGVMGNGKTSNAMEYKARNNHGRTCYYRCEPGLTLAQFVTGVADACGLKFKGRRTQTLIREKTYSILSAGNRLLIIDEFHQLFLRRESRDITPVLQAEYLRAIHDISGAGISIISTDALSRHLIDNSEALAQLLDRGPMGIIKLPAKPTGEDVKAFIKNYGLCPLTDREPVAQAVVKDILQSSGLRKLVMYLRQGASYAKKIGEPYAWHHFTKAFEDIQSLNKARR